MERLDAHRSLQGRDKPRARTSGLVRDQSSRCAAAGPGSADVLEDEPLEQEQELARVLVDAAAGAWSPELPDSGGDERVAHAAVRASGVGTPPTRRSMGFASMRCA